MQWKENRFRVGRSENTINGCAPEENDSKTVHNQQPDLNGSTKDEDMSRVHNDNLKKRGQKSEIPFSDTSDSDLEFDDTSKRVKDSSEILHPVNSKPSTSALSTNSAIELKDDMSIEEALDAIIQEDLSHSKTTLEIKETDDEIEISDE